MTASVLPKFQIHWSPVPSGETGALASPGCQLLAVWPAPVNPDVCFEEAGFSLFGDNDADWDEAAEELLRRVIENLSRFGAVKQLSKQLRDNPPWYLRLFRARRELPFQQQAALPMQWDSLPSFHAQFGDSGAALWTGNGHFLLWISLPNAGPGVPEFINTIAGPWPVVETGLRWAFLLPSGTR